MQNKWSGCFEKRLSVCTLLLLLTRGTRQWTQWKYWFCVLHNGTQNRTGNGCLSVDCESMAGGQWDHSKIGMCPHGLPTVRHTLLVHRIHTQHTAHISHNPINEVGFSLCGALNAPSRFGQTTQKRLCAYVIRFSLELYWINTQWQWQNKWLCGNQSG